LVGLFLGSSQGEAFFPQQLKVPLHFLGQTICPLKPCSNPE
jgi:hypothetical protein